MEFDRTALAPATLAASIAGAVVLAASLTAPAYAADYGSGSSQQAPSSGATAPRQSNDAPPNPANGRDMEALDTDKDGVISPDEQRQLRPGMKSGTTGTSGSGTMQGDPSSSGAIGTMPPQGNTGSSGTAQPGTPPQGTQAQPTDNIRP